jgi:hypothetical protein
MPDPISIEKAEDALEAAWEAAEDDYLAFTSLAGHFGPEGAARLDQAEASALEYVEALRRVRRARQHIEDA